MIAILLSAALHQKPIFERGAPLARKGLLGVSAELKQGSLLVSMVVPKGTADAAGVQKGDQVVRVNSDSVKTVAELVAEGTKWRAGTQIRFEVVRDGKRLKLESVLQERPRAVEPNLETIYDQVLTKGNRVRIILTKPAGAGPFPTVFLVGGIGAYSIDAPMRSMVYGRIMGPISTSGYVTVRVDKPGQGDSEGPEYKGLGFYQEADAYVQALRLVKTLPYVDSKRIAIYGHSMGGCFGPIVASQEPVKALIVNGTIFESFAEYMLENDRRQSELGGADAQQLDDEQRQMAAVDYYLFDKGEDPKSIIRHHPELAARVKSAFPDLETFSGVGLPFFRELARTNVPAMWAKANADVLALYGENDFLSGRSDHERLVAYVNKLRPGTARLAVLPNTDHVWTRTTSMRDSMDKWGHGGEFNPTVNAEIASFLSKELQP